MPAGIPIDEERFRLVLEAMWEHAIGTPIGEELTKDIDLRPPPKVVSIEC